MARPTPPPQHPQIRNHAPLPRRDDQEGNPMTDEWMRHPVTGLTAPHHATQTDEQAQDAPVDVQEPQKTREERWAKHARRVESRRALIADVDLPTHYARSFMALADEEVLAAITVARQDMAQCVAERDQARAEVANLRMQYEASQGALSDLMTEHREDAEALQRGLAAAEAIVPQGSGEWVESGEAMKRTILHTIRGAALAAEPTPPTAPHAEDGPNLDGSRCWKGREGCACRDGHPAPVADLSGTGETR